MQSEDNMNNSFQSETSTVIVQNGDESFITVISETDEIQEDTYQQYESE